ncbi:pyrroline-5-carboxylate reductase [soil metagenome]
MGSALLAQWGNIADRDFPEHRFFVIDPAADFGVDTARITFLRAPPPVGESAFDLVIVAVKPQIVDAVLPDYAPRLTEGGFVASIAAGCSIARLSALAGGAPVIRVMPNLPAAIGAGVSGLCSAPSARAAQRDAVEALMSAVGTTLWVEDEDKLDRLTAIAGSGPGYVFEIARSYVAAAEALGFSADAARQLVLGTMAGTIALAQASDESLGALRTSVTSKGGTTAAGLDALNADGWLSARIHATVDAAYRRAIELR